MIIHLDQSFNFVRPIPFWASFPHISKLDATSNFLKTFFYISKCHFFNLCIVVLDYLLLVAYFSQKGCQLGFFKQILVCTEFFTILLEGVVKCFVIEELDLGWYNGFGIINKEIRSFSCGVFLGNIVFPQDFIQKTYPLLFKFFYFISKPGESCLQALFSSR